MPLNSLYVSFKPIFYLSTLHGTMPLYFCSKPFLHLRISKIRVIFSLSCFFCTVAHGALSPWFVVENKSPAVNIITDTSTNVTDIDRFINQTSNQIITLKVLNSLINTFMSLGSLWVSLTFTTLMLPEFLIHLADVDRKMTPFTRSLCPRFNMLVSLLIFVYYLSLVVPISCYYLYSIYSQGTFWSKVWSTIVMFNISSSFTAEIQFINWALCLKLRFRAINSFLQIFSGHNVLKKLKYFRCKLLDLNERITLQKIELAHECNKTLCYLAQDLNAMFQLQLFCTLAGCFIKILINIYFGLFNSLVSNSRQANVQMANIIMWSIFYCVRFLVTTIVASITSREASETKTLVSAVNRKSFHPSLKEEAVAAGTTYLVILVQFRPQIS